MMICIGKNLFTIPASLFVVASAFVAGEALAISITATVNDDGTNTTLFGTELQDGDFLLKANTGNPPSTLLGDGIDETITWDFDFNTDSALSDFLVAINSGADLTSAAITFEVIPTNSLITTDWTGIPSVKSIAIPNIPGVTFSVNQNTVFTLELLDLGFNSTQILNSFNTGTLNSVPWYWQDDVIIKSASLTLETETTPEPHSLLGLLAIGALGTTSLKRNHKAKK
ncbi:MAG: PEP-CTERM sorting domain-containing protein [Moorea sp. SIO2B7]|nr:PEP-CTERM sorting domain-containing protein [Moorena sp. SIO2B7]